MASKELALELALTAILDWKREEARAHDGIAFSRGNAVALMRKAVDAGVSQSAIAEGSGFSRQRVHQLVSER
jgi:hypothetical protein